MAFDPMGYLTCNRLSLVELVQRTIDIPLDRYPHFYQQSLVQVFGSKNKMEKHMPVWKRRAMKVLSSGLLPLLSDLLLSFSGLASRVNLSCPEVPRNNVTRKIKHFHRKTVEKAISNSQRGVHVKQTRY